MASSLAKCPIPTTVNASLSFSVCTNCHMNIVSKECVKCPKGKPYHRLCLLQKNISQHVMKGTDYNYPVCGIKTEEIPADMCAHTELLKQRYAAMFFHRKTVRLFSMSDEEFAL